MENLLMRATISNNVNSTGLQRIIDPISVSTNAVECPKWEEAEVVVNVTQLSASDTQVSYLEVAFEDSPQEYLALELCELTVM